MIKNTKGSEQNRNDGIGGRGVLIMEVLLVKVISKL